MIFLQTKSIYCIEVCRPYVVAVLNCTALFVCYMVMPVVKMDTKITRVMMRSDYMPKV